MTFILGAIGFLLAITLLIAFHEFGHYWVAKKAGIKILCFAIGFGKPIYYRTFGPDNSLFVIGILPLGGYVRMLDEREGTVPEEELPRAFNRQSLGVRTAVVAAGPLANFLLAFFLYIAVFSFGAYDSRAIIDEVAANSPAMQAGFQHGDEIYAIDGQRVHGSKQTILAIIESALDHDRFSASVISASGMERVVRVETIDGQALLDDGRPIFEVLGISLLRPELPAIIGGVLPDSAAEYYGLQVGDKITHFNDQVVANWKALTTLARAHPNQDVVLTVERRGQPLQVNLVTDITEAADGTPIGQLGVRVQALDAPLEDYQVHIQYSPLEAINEAVKRTVSMTWLTMKFIWYMLTGNISFENISGPITIAEATGVSFLMGLVTYLNIIALISISIGIINLLPIPVLDGGHLLYYLVEFVTGRPLSLAAQMRGQFVGMFLVGSLIVLALYNDIQRLLQ